MGGLITEVSRPSSAMIRTILFIVFCMSCLACKEKIPAVAPEIMVSLSDIQAEEEPGSYTFHVKSNTEWTADASELWSVLSVLHGEAGTTRVDVKVERNGSAHRRESILTIRSGAVTSQVKLVQKGADILNVNQSEFELTAAGGEIGIEVEASSVVMWEEGPFWIEQKTGNGNSFRLIIGENPTHFSRTASLTLSSGKAQKVIRINQKGKDFNIAPDQRGVESDAATLAGKIHLGWNLGNSLEACSDENSASETLWGNPRTSQALIDLIKRSGFNAVRIPTAWSGYVEDQNTFKIKDEWIMRVREVVDYCVENGMYAIINIHWDGGWLENNPTYAKQAEVNRKQKALWEQIAVAFRDYDEHLLFAGTNEVHADYNRPTAEHLAVQMSYNQTFVNAVRSTGGKNAWRVLVAQGYNTNIQYTYESLVMPEDVVAKRMMAEVHYYDPYDFTIDGSATAKYLWGKDFKGNPGASNWGQEEWVETTFETMRAKFVSRGIPVVLGEYAASYRATLPDHLLTEHKKARNYYLNYVTRAARKYGLLPFYWDNGGTGNNASGIFDRHNLTVVHADALEALISAGK